MKKFKEYIKEKMERIIDALPSDQAVLLPCTNDELNNKLDIAIKEELGASISQEKVDRLSERIVRSLAGDVARASGYGIQRHIKERINNEDLLPATPTSDNHIMVVYFEPNDQIHLYILESQHRTQINDLMDYDNMDPVTQYIEDNKIDEMNCQSMVWNAYIFGKYNIEEVINLPLAL